MVASENQRFDARWSLLNLFILKFSSSSTLNLLKSSGNSYKSLADKSKTLRLGIYYKLEMAFGNTLLKLKFKFSNFRYASSTVKNNSSMSLYWNLRVTRDGNVSNLWNCILFSLTSNSIKLVKYYKSSVFTSAIPFSRLNILRKIKIFTWCFKSY